MDRLLHCSGGHRILSGTQDFFFVPRPWHAGYHIFHNLSLVSHASSIRLAYASLLSPTTTPHPTASNLLSCFEELELTAEPRYKKSLKSQNKWFAITWFYILYILSVCYTGFFLAGFTLNDLKCMYTQHFQNFRQVPHCSFKRGLVWRVLFSLFLVLNY